MRIVGGRFRGRPLAAPSDDATRPTSDRVREAVFNILVHGIPGFEIEGAKVLDLFAGTGALGLEALSRGAGFCLFVEESAEARALIRDVVLITEVVQARSGAAALAATGHVDLAERTLDLQLMLKPNPPTDRPLKPSDMAGAEGVTVRGFWQEPVVRGEEPSADSQAR